MSSSERWPNARQAWEPYRPGTDGPWDAARVAHLHRRAGFGATWDQLRRDVADGYEASLRRVLEGESHGPDGRTAREFEELTTLMEEDARNQPTVERVQLGWLFRLLFTPFPLAEKMTLAWHSHYATSNDKVRDPLRMLEQNATLRRLWRAPASQLHAALLRDPALLKWLDGADNTRERPNENLGREFLELFALGEGHYSEQDVREVARALTGWEDEVRQQPHFNARRHDDGAKTILGATGNWGEADVVRIVCQQPEAARHIARRLFRTFVSDTDEPPAGLLEPLAEAMRRPGDVDLARGIEMVLRSRLFHGPACRGRRVKSPVEFALGALRACEAFAPPPDLADVEIHLAKMGQRLFYPPNVAGWPGGLTWLGGSTILARGQFAATFADPASPYGPRHLLELTRRRGWTTPEQWPERFATLLLGSPLRDPKRLEAAVRGTGPDAALQCGRLVQSLLTLPEAQVC
jgi:uncharacterized protein (DUF1800 family)